MNNFDFENLYLNKEGKLRLWLYIPFLNAVISFAIIVPLLVAIIPLTTYRVIRDLLES